MGGPEVQHRDVKSAETDSNRVDGTLERWVSYSWPQIVMHSHTLSHTNSFDAEVMS